MASFSFLLIIFISFITSSPSLSLSSHLNIENSFVISASPALLPDPPSSSPSPNLSPDILPQFPTPGGSNNVSPSEGPSSSMPTIPSNPSPPNPDEMITSKPNMAISPSGSMLPTSSASRNLIGSGVLGLVMAAWLLLLLQLFGDVKV